MTTKLSLPAKKNKDGSYSLSITARDLIQHSFVDYYDDRNGTGYQRNESVRAARARDISEYIKRCRQSDLLPQLFELTGNARLPKGPKVDFEAYDNSDVGCLRIVPSELPWLSIIDGGTRREGIDVALRQGHIDDNFSLDMRLFVGLRLGEEVAQFLLINEKQKRVRTDLSLRVVQTKLDSGELNEHEQDVLKTVVPRKDAWKYESSRVSGIMNSQNGSPWKGLIQMPDGQTTGLPIKLQAYFTSLKPILTDDDLAHHIEQITKESPEIKSETEALVKILLNFWSAVAKVNPSAYEEPDTNVLWGSIGVNACHIALAPILLSILQSNERDLSEDRFVAMLENSAVADYGEWFTKAGAKGSEYYFDQKGEMTKMTGAANYKRVADRLEQEWRAALFREMSTRPAVKL